jgi:hypothetical protein
LQVGRRNVLVMMDRRQKREDRLTEVFVHLLNHLKETHQHIASAVLTALAPGIPGLSADDMPLVKVDAQKPIDYQGMKLRKGRRPTADITVRSPIALIYVEVKRDSPPDLEQMHKYLWHLGQQPSPPHRAAVLLTISMPRENWLNNEMHHYTVRWTHIAEILRSHRDTITDLVSGVRVDDFLGFLQEDGMTLERVSKHLVEGLRPMMHLMTLIEDVVEWSPRLTHSRNSGMQGYSKYLGYAFDIRKGRSQTRTCFVGVYFSQPSQVVFEFLEHGDSAALQRWWREQGFKESPRDDDPDWQTKSWDLVDDSFFDLDLEGQRRYIEELVESGIEVACQRTPSANTKLRSGSYDKQ